MGSLGVPNKFHGRTCSLMVVLIIIIMLVLVLLLMMLNLSMTQLMIVVVILFLFNGSIVFTYFLHDMSRDIIMLL